MLNSLSYRYGDGRTVLVADGPAATLAADPDVVQLSESLDALIDSAIEALDDGNPDQAADILASAEETADSLLDALGGVDADEDDDDGAVAARQNRLAAVGRLRAASRRLTASRTEAPDDAASLGCGCCADCSSTCDGSCCSSCSSTLAIHEAMTGPHSHTHSHGDGTTHTHGHFHSDSNVHNHSHAAAATPETLSALSERERREVDGENEITDEAELDALVASLLARFDPDVLTAAAETEPAEWHSYVAWEGIQTDEMPPRVFPLGVFEYAEFPLSLRILIEDDGGHWGAVTCGRIDTIVPVDFEALGRRAHLATGIFGSDPNGQLAQLMVTEQTQRFVSVDMRAIECEFVEVVTNREPIGLSSLDDDDDPFASECFLRYITATIGAATVVPMPAIREAVIALATVDLPVPTPPVALAASATPQLPEVDLGKPQAWFYDDPGFYDGDPRLVLQADGRSYACPLDVSQPDPETGYRHVFAHLAWWNCDHTGFPGRHVKPPRSAASYAYYLTGPGVECADGSIVKGVGAITMGCGHAPVKASATEAIAHYDGGYGAVHVANVRAGEDAYGIWVSGAVRPEISESELRDFLTLSLSGDWREIAGSLELVAALAVPVPGFPIRRNLVAAGAENGSPSDLHALFVGDEVEPKALVAAGIVRPVSPEERLARLERIVELQTAEIGKLRSASVADRRRRFGL